MRCCLRRRLASPRRADRIRERPRELPSGSQEIWNLPWLDGGMPLAPVDIASDVEDEAVIELPQAAACARAAAVRGLRLRCAARPGTRCPRILVQRDVSVCAARWASRAVPLVAVLVMVLLIGPVVIESTSTSAAETTATTATGSATTSTILSTRAMPSPTVSAPLATSPLASPQPAYDGDAADPFMIVTSSGPMVFTTNTGLGNVPVHVDSGTATDDEPAIRDALPTLPAWADPGSTWAPAVISVQGSYVLGFSARDSASGLQCIGVATSTTPEGPYAPDEQPLICELDAGGAIDPSFLVTGEGTIRLLYKTDGNCCGVATSIRTVSLDETATSVVAEARTLLTADQPWEGGIVEAPSMIAVGDRWLLLYSANDWEDAAYAVGAAWCDTAVGPCTKVAEPVLQAGAGFDGPGGLEVVAGSGDTDATLAVFHAWPSGSVGYALGSARQLHVGRVEIRGDGVVVAPVV